MLFTELHFMQAVNSNGLTEKGDGDMAQLNFENEEIEKYYRQMRRNLGIGHPSHWDHKPKITKEDVDNYVKDAKNILAC